MKNDKKNTESRDCTLQDFYDKAATAPSGFSFLSPTALEPWCTNTATWISRGETVCEIGPGNGNLALRTIDKCSSPLNYVMLDISQVMLDVVKDKLSEKNNSLVKFEYVKADIESRLPDEISEVNIDRLIAVNVLQDADINNALRNIKKILKPTGLFRATFIAKEFQDLFWEDNPYYDQINGRWYSGSYYHDTKKCKPLGYHMVDAQKKPFYRLLNCFTRKDIHTFLGMVGFKVLNIEPIIYPVEYVLKRWNSKYHHIKLDEKQLKLLKKWNGYSDGWSVEAKMSESSAL